MENQPIFRWFHCTQKGESTSACFAYTVVFCVPLLSASQSFKKSRWIEKILNNILNNISNNISSGTVLQKSEQDNSDQS